MMAQQEKMMSRSRLLIILITLLLAIISCDCMARNERHVNRSTAARRAAAAAASVILNQNHDRASAPEQIQQMMIREEPVAAEAAKSTLSGMNVIPVVVIGETLLSTDTTTVNVAAAPGAALTHNNNAVRNLALEDLELHNPRAPMKRTPDNIPEPGSIPRDELERLVEAAALAAARNSSSSSNDNDGERNEGVIIAVATLVPLAVLVASFLVLRKTQHGRSELATSHLSPDFAAPDMSFPAAAGAGIVHSHRGSMMSNFGRGGAGGRVVLSPISTLDTIPEEQEDLVGGGGKSPFRFRGIV